MPTNFAPAVHGVQLSTALREAAAYAPVDRVILVTYEFTHPSFTDRALVVASYENLVAKTETGEEVTFLAIAGLKSEGFEETDGENSPLVRLSLDGVSPLIAEKLDLAIAGLQPIGLIERVYTSDDLTTPALLPPAQAIVRSATVTETTVSIEAGFGDPANQPFPRYTYQRAQYPGLAA